MSALLMMTTARAGRADRNLSIAKFTHLRELIPYHFFPRRGSLNSFCLVCASRGEAPARVLPETRPREEWLQWGGSHVFSISGERLRGVASSPVTTRSPRGCAGNGRPQSADGPEHDERPGLPAMNVSARRPASFCVFLCRSIEGIPVSRRLVFLAASLGGTGFARIAMKIPSGRTGGVL